LSGIYAPFPSRDAAIKDEPEQAKEAEVSQGAPWCAVDPADASPISSIACAFGQEILFGSAMDMSELASSYAASAAAAPWRGDVTELGVHLQRAGSAIKAARMTVDAIEAEKSKSATAERTSA
jgi:hypothetical protein